MNVELKLGIETYNGLYQALGEVVGTHAAPAANKLQELIATTAQANVVDVPATDDTPARKDLPNEITFNVDRKILDAIYLGLVEMTKKDKITVAEFTKIRAISAVIKCKNRMEKHIETELSKFVELDEPLDNEVVDEPLDD